jgi:hypothetical protein
LDAELAARGFASADDVRGIAHSDTANDVAQRVTLHTTVA